MDQIEFQLKLHTLQRTILIKQDQLQVVEAKLDKIGSIRIESQNQIIQLISDVHKTMKSLDRIIEEIKDPCYELGMNSLYDIFRNICYTMINAVKLLGEGCQNGVQRNLFRYYASSSPNNQIKGETFCVESKNDENNQIETSIKQKQETYCDALTQLQISKLYLSIQAEKQSVMKTFPSNVVTKLNEVRASWLKIVDDSDKILEEAYYRKNEDARSNFAQKLHKAEYITKVLKQELSQSLKKYFKDTVQRTIKKMYSLFYLNEYQKLKSQYEKERVTKIQAQVQTDVEGINKIKQWQRERKINEKVTKQLQHIKTEKNRINQQYLIAAGNNELYIKRIQELQRKLLTFIPINLRSIDKRLSQDKKMMQSKRDSIKQPQLSPQKDKQNIQKNQINPKFNMIYSNQNNQINQSSQQIKGEVKSQNSQKNQNEKENQIIPKKNKMKRVYNKSKLQTDYLEKGHKLQKKTSIIESSLISSSNNEIKNQRDSIKSKDLLQNKSLQQIQFVNSEQLKLAVAKILQFTHQLKKDDEQNQQKNKEQLNQSNNIVNEQQKSKQNEISVSAHHQILADKIISNSSMKGVLSRLLRKAISMNKNIKQQKKQPSERLSVSKKNQVASQQSLKPKQNKSLVNIVVEESNNINSQKYKKSRNSIQKLNLFAKKIRHSKEQSSFFHLKPKDFPQEVEKDRKSIQIDKNQHRLSGQLNKIGHKTLGQELMRQILANRTKTQGNGTGLMNDKQKEQNERHRKSKEKHLQNSLFENLNISQFSNNVFKMKVKQTFKNAVSSENLPKGQPERPNTETLRELQQNNKLIAIKSVKSNEVKQKLRCQNNKITKDIIEICRNIERRKSNTQLQKVLSNYLQAHLINNVSSTAQRRKSSKLLKNRIETE